LLKTFVYYHLMITHTGQNVHWIKRSKCLYNKSLWHNENFKSSSQETSRRYKGMCMYMCLCMYTYINCVYDRRDSDSTVRQNVMAQWSCNTLTIMTGTLDIFSFSPSRKIQGQHPSRPQLLQFTTCNRPVSWLSVTDALEEALWNVTNRASCWWHKTALPTLSTEHEKGKEMKEIFLFSTGSRSGQRPTQVPVKWITRILSLKKDSVPWNYLWWILSN
jgi:hypothetical protein